MQKIYNKELQANNVFVINDLDLKSLGELKTIYDENISENLEEKYIGDPNGDAHFSSALSPATWDSDIKWVAANNAQTHKRLSKYFDIWKLDEVFDSLIEHENAIVVYSAFFVVRSRCTKRSWHYDYEEGGGVNAFTLLLPLYDMEKPNTLHLDYAKKDGDIGTYEYKKGQAIAFGEEFVHSTSEGYSDWQQPLFCLEFGSDKKEYFDLILKTVATQGEHFMHPHEGFISYNNFLKL